MIVKPTLPSLLLIDIAFLPFVAQVTYSGFYIETSNRSCFIESASFWRIIAEHLSNAMNNCLGMPPAPIKSSDKLSEAKNSQGSSTIVLL